MGICISALFNNLVPPPASAATTLPPRSASTTFWSSLLVCHLASRHAAYRFRSLRTFSSTFLFQGPDAERGFVTNSAVCVDSPRRPDAPRPHLARRVLPLHPPFPARRTRRCRCLHRHHLLQPAPAAGPVDGGPALSRHDRVSPAPCLPQFIFPAHMHPRCHHSASYPPSTPPSSAVHR